MTSIENHHLHFTSSLLYVCKVAPCCDIAIEIKLKLCKLKS